MLGLWASWSVQGLGQTRRQSCRDSHPVQTVLVLGGCAGVAGTKHRWPWDPGFLKTLRGSLSYPRLPALCPCSAPLLHLPWGPCPREELTSAWGPVSLTSRYVF